MSLAQVKGLYIRVPCAVETPWFIGLAGALGHFVVLAALHKAHILVIHQHSLKSQLSKSTIQLIFFFETEFLSVALSILHSLCRPGWFRMHSHLPTCASQVLELKVHTTMPGTVNS